MWLTWPLGTFTLGILSLRIPLLRGTISLRPPSDKRIKPRGEALEDPGRYVSIRERIGGKEKEWGQKERSEGGNEGGRFKEGENENIPVMCE